MNAVQVDRFWAKVVKSADGCWLWTGASTQGYGDVGIDGKTRKAHRVAWELSGRTLDPSLTLDHLCRNRACVNPDHLEQVTNRENLLRGTSPSAVHARKTHCPWGHEYTPENTTIRANGARRCKACREAANRELNLCTFWGRTIHRSSMTRHFRREHPDAA